MQLRIIRAASMPAALRAVRAELGEDALILSSRKIAGGIEVAAAAPPAADQLPPPLAPLPRPAQPGEGRGDARPPTVASGAGQGPQALLFAHGVSPAVCARLPETLRFATLPLGPDAAPLLFAGPPGAGKTLTVAKLATRLCLAGVRPMVITTDTARAGAIEQLAAFTHLLDLDLLVAPDPQVLARALAGRGHEPVLIDTAGADVLDAAQAAGLSALARAASAVQVLVLPANFDAEEAAAIAHGHAALGARHLVATRIDQSRRIGAVLAAASQGLAIGGFGIGPGAADGFQAPEPDFLAARLATPPSYAGVAA